MLEGAQAGLSWLTLLRKRENYNVVFDFRGDAARESGAGVYDEGPSCRRRDVARGGLELRAAAKGDADELGLHIPVADSVGHLETLLVADADVCEEPLGDSEGRSQAAA